MLLTIVPARPPISGMSSRGLLRGEPATRDLSRGACKTCEIPGRDIFEENPGMTADNVAIPGPLNSVISNL